MYRDNLSRIRAISFAIAITLLGFSAAAPATAADLQNRHRFEIPAQALDTALLAFSDQAKVQVLMWAGAQSDAKSFGATGELRSLDALEAILENTGLVFQQIDSETVAILKPGTSPGATGGALGIERTNFRLAQVDSRSEHQENNRNQGATESSDAESSPEKIELEEVIITGTRIRGVEHIAAPSFSFTREDMDRAGFTSLEQLFESIPQNLDELTTEGSLATGVSRVANENSEGAAGISLRGLGPTATLVLLNGQRRPGNVLGQVFDISAIPFAVIERVEVVTGGRSALYGSDAVAGVVNLITRRDFEGAETAVSYGAPMSGGGGDRFQASQTVGLRGERGGFVGAFDFSRSTSLDASDAGGVGSQHPAGLLPVPGRFTLVPDSTRHSGYLAGHHALGENVEVFAEGIYTDSRNRTDFTFFNDATPDPLDVTFQTGDTRSKQYSVSGGAKFDIGRWKLDASGIYGIVDNVLESVSNAGPGGVNSKAATTTVSAIADGPLFSIGDNEVKMAFGVEHREEDLDSTSIATGTNFRSGKRSIEAVFGELHVPLVVDGETPGLRGLELSIAGRYDDYSDFGDTFNPQGGVVWTVVDGVHFRGSYSEAFRAPDLSPSAAGTSAFLFRLPDPTSANLTPSLVLIGADPNIQPERAKTWSVGVDLEPQGAPWLRFSTSYFDIAFDDRIDDPAGANFFFALANGPALGDLINRSPTQGDIDATFAQIAASGGGFVDFTSSCFTPAICGPSFLTLFPNALVFDNRRGNIAFETVRGIDFDLDTTFDSGSGQFTFGVNGTYYLDYERRITPNGLAIPQSDRPGKPVDLRLRGNAGWIKSGFGVFAYVNYVDSHRDPTPVPATTIKSWTTVDLTLQYNTSVTVDDGPFDNFKVTLGIQNVFDKDPPLFTGNIFSLNYDGANANTIGRFASLNLVKKW